MKLVIIFIFIAGFLQALLSFDFSSERTKVFIGPSKNIKGFTLGYDDFIASVMWVRVVQDFHVCDQNSKAVKYPGFTDNVDPVDEVLSRELPDSRCEDGWVYQMLDVISDLQPKFKSVYLDGGSMLSVLVDDRTGAQKIIQKGLIPFPNDWKLLYQAAYHELFEMQNANTAQELMLRAAENGAPSWVYSLAAKLMTRTGRAALALPILQSVLDRNLGGMHEDRIRAQLDRVKKHLMNASPE